MRLEDKFKALVLRRDGKTYSEIRAIIPNLSKGTLCGWVKNIELTTDQKNNILKKIENGANSARAIQRQRGAWTNHLKMVASAKAIITSAKKEVTTLLKNPFFVPGVMLYWAEGDKSLNVQRVSFTNSDPLMISFMMKWFRVVCKVPEKKFRVRINIHALLSESEMEQYWSNITKIPLSQFNKPTIKPTLFTQAKNPFYKGTCYISINDVSLFRRIMSWKIAILEQWGFETKNAPVAQWIERMFSKH